ncbi:Trp biosynthesis-associated membrane protein [Cnuibacter sp. UC19_7]|uniref:Trp biosynthesis-associated membrane protein n=1 Tax=Cnuibacter sp. UC19_7 TaxID=3350166 RepID=UPI00367286CB
MTDHDATASETEADEPHADAALSAGRRIKVLTILVVLVASALGFLAWSQTWSTLQLSGSESVAATITVPGSVAAPALSALSLAGIALAGALAIAGPVVRLVLGVLELVLGASVLWSSIAAATDPVAAGASSVTTTTGVAGSSSVRSLITGHDATLWPAAAIVAGALMVIAGLLVLVTVRRWPASGRKYQAVVFEDASGARSTDPGDFFDDGSTAPEPKATRRERSDAAVDDWDDLTRGDDPTR